MVTIDLNSNKCISCGKCVRICPSGLFSISEGKVSVSPKGCISCGHCVAVCPSGAITHSEFPEGKVHDFDRSGFPDPDSVELLLKARRSNRAFSGREIPETHLRRIVEAAHRAPTASNLQQVGIIVVTDPEKLKQISEATVGKLYSLARLLACPPVKAVLKKIMPGNYKYLPSFLKMKSSLDSGKDPILRGAKAAIFFVTPKKCRFGRQDSNLAYQNASIMAESLGVAHFYTGFVCSVADMDSRRIGTILGISGTIHAGMALGMPAFCFEKYIDRKDADVRYI